MCIYEMYLSSSFLLCSICWDTCAQQSWYSNVAKCWSLALLITEVNFVKLCPLTLAQLSMVSNLCTCESYPRKCVSHGCGCLSPPPAVSSTRSPSWEWVQWQRTNMITVVLFILAVQHHSQCSILVNKVWIIQMIYLFIAFLPLFLWLGRVERFLTAFVTDS